MQSNMMKKRALQEAKLCDKCNQSGCACPDHNEKVRALDLPKNAMPSSEYEQDKTYQDKGEETDLNLSIDAAVSPAKGVLDYIKQKRVALEQILQTRGEAAVVAKASKDLTETVPGVANVNTNLLGGVIAKYLIQITQKAKGQKVTPAFNDSQFLQEIEPILERKHASMNTASKNLKDKSEEELEEMESSDKSNKTKMKKQPEGEKKASLKLAAEGGAEDEEETEEQTSVDSAVVALLDSCKNEWTNLGEPVNPGTWPKEIERAILNLNDSLIKAIESTESKLIEGEFYSKNVDEGVSSAGGGSAMMDDLSVAPAEEGVEGVTNDELVEEAPLDNEIKAKKSSKTAAADITSTETKKALKFVEDLQEKVAALFFDYKKTVEAANNSALVKSAGEDLVRLKTKLSEVEKVMSKQLSVLSEAEEAIEKQNKENAKSSKQSSKFMGLSLASEE